MGARMRRFEDYVSLTSGQLGHADRVLPFRGYCTGLMLLGERKSVEPMAARVAPAAVRTAHQRLHHFVADASWSDAAVLGAIRSHVVGTVCKAPAQGMERGPEAAQEGGCGKQNPSSTSCPRCLPLLRCANWYA